MDQELLRAVSSAMARAKRHNEDPDRLVPLPRGQSGLRPLWANYKYLAFAAIRELRKLGWMKPEWQPIETAPKDYPYPTVDLWCDGRRWTDMEWQSSSPMHPYGAWKKADSDWQDTVDIEPSHWMWPPKKPG